MLSNEKVNELINYFEAQDKSVEVQKKLYLLSKMQTIYYCLDFSNSEKDTDAIVNALFRLNNEYNKI